MIFWYLSHMRETHPDEFSGAKGLNFSLSLHLHPHFVYASREYFDESAHLHLIV